MGSAGPSVDGHVRLLSFALNGTTQADIGFGDKQVADMEKATPLRRRPEAIDIANTVAWLASDTATMLIGQLLSVSGGCNMPR